MTGEGRIPTRAPEGDFDQEVWEIVAGNLGKANLQDRGVTVAEGPNVVGRSGTPSGLAGPLDAQFLEFTLSVTNTLPTADVEVPHRLGRVPKGFLLCASDYAGVVLSGHPEGGYGSQGGNEAPWTTGALFLRGLRSLSGTVTARVRVLIF